MKESLKSFLPFFSGVACFGSVLVQSSTAAVRIANPGFEEPFTPNGSAYLGTIPGWTEPSGLENCGVAWRHSTYDLYENGLEPEGKQVAFLHFASRNQPVTLLQNIDGFKAGKRYITRFSCNARAVYSDPAYQASGVTFSVRLGNQVILPETDLKPVEPRGSFTKPFYKMTGAVFQPDQDGAYTLSFTFFPTLAYDTLLTSVVLHEQCLLLDDVRIELETNEAPVFQNLSPQKIYAGQNFRFAFRTDDEQFQKVSYSLESAPPGAVLDADSGLLNWMTENAAPGIYTFTVKATDNGSPPKSSTAVLSLEVVTPPRLRILFEPEEKRLLLQWTGIGQSDYRVEKTTDLATADWQSVGGVVSGISDQEYTWEEQEALEAPIFYRLRMMPKNP